MIQFFITKPTIVSKVHLVVCYQKHVFGLDILLDHRLRLLSSIFPESKAKVFCHHRCHYCLTNQTLSRFNEDNFCPIYQGVEVLRQQILG